MRRLGGIFRLSAIVVLEIAAVIGLHWLGGKAIFQIDWSHLHDWLATNSLQNLIGASMRLFGLALAYYLLITTVLYIGLALLHQRAGLRILSFITLPALRGSLDRALAVAILTTGIVGGSASFAMADSSAPFPGLPPGLVPPSQRQHTTATTQGTSKSNDNGLNKILQGIPFPGGPGSTTTTGKTTSTTSPAPAPVIPGLGQSTTPTTTKTPAPAPQVPTKVEGEQTYKVVPDDNLWTISKAHLAAVRGVDPSTLSDRDIAQYWLIVIDVNTPHLRSGNPDLIYPGESITLPAV